MHEVYSHVRTKVGSLTVNLSEYARLSGSSRRYFLQECKLNCTLKVGSIQRMLFVLCYVLHAGLYLHTRSALCALRCPLRPAPRARGWSRVTQAGTHTPPTFPPAPAQSTLIILIICSLSISISQQSGPDQFDVPALNRSMVLTDLNDMITSENGTTRSGRDSSTKGATSFSSRQHSIIRNNSANGNLPFTSASSVHTNTTRSNTTETSTSRALLPIDNTDIRDLAPFQVSSKTNQKIVDDVFFSSPSLPT
ncbi:hypothetical protein LPJ57_006063 [Coemansia sp. RSA 486]|nr:hypothetical protein LPJ57_006063 [Coemansia sp. RSA 486]